MKNWIEVKAVFTESQADWSPIAEVFDRYGCPGTLEEDEPPALTSYLAETDGAAARVRSLSEELVNAGACRVETNTLPEENWSENWKQYFKTRHIGQVVIRPTWESYDPVGGEVVVSLDPGQAFGTGDHPTTRLCLRLLQQADVRGKKVADVGCGSGILAIASAKLGAAAVVATDIDPQSVEIARENSVLNEVDFPIVAAAGFDGIEGRFDIILSNIITATLIRLAPRAPEYVEAGGYWIVSGIISANWEDLRAAAEKSGFRLEEKEQEDDWVGAIFRL